MRWGVRRNIFVVFFLCFQLAFGPLPITTAVAMAVDPSNQGRSIKSIWDRIQELEATTLNQLGSSLLASLTAVGALWHIKGHVSSIREGVVDIYYFRGNRKTYLESEDQLKKFEDNVLRESSDRLPDGTPAPPSLLQSLIPAIQRWTRTAEAMDRHVLQLLPPSSDIPFRNQLYHHLTGAITQQIAGGYRLVESLKPAVQSWEQTGDLTAIEKWIDDQLRSSGILAVEISGQEWLQRYTQLTLALGAEQWMVSRSQEALNAWHTHNQNRPSVSPAQIKWWEELTALRNAELAEGKRFALSYGNFIRNLNDWCSKHKKSFPALVFIGDLRDTGELHEGDVPVSVFSVLEHAKTKCSDALSAYTSARDSAAQKGTYFSIVKIASQKILFPATLVFAGAASAFVAFQGFRNIITTIFFP